MDGSVAEFLAASALIIANPGQDTVLTIRSAILGGRWAGIACAAGVAAGQGVWTVAASAGLAAILTASETLFLTIRLVGAGYVILLGARSLWAARERVTTAGPLSATQDPRVGASVAFRWGLLSSLGNPMIAIFFSSLLPQFIPPNAPKFAGMIMLGLLFITMNLGWLGAYASVTAHAGRVLLADSTRRAINVISGGFLVVFGVRLLTLEVP